VQRVDVKAGEVVTILYGMSRCDGSFVIEFVAWQ